MFPAKNFKFKFKVGRIIFKSIPQPAITNSRPKLHLWTYAQAASFDIVSLENVSIPENAINRAAKPSKFYATLNSIQSSLYRLTAPHSFIVCNQADADIGTNRRIPSLPQPYRTGISASSSQNCADSFKFRDCGSKRGWKYGFLPPQPTHSHARLRKNNFPLPMTVPRKNATQFDKRRHLKLE